MNVSKSAFEKVFVPKNISQIKDGILLQSFQTKAKNLIAEVSFAESAITALGSSTTDTTAVIKVSSVPIVPKPVVVSKNNLAPNKNPNLTVTPETSRDFSMAILTVPASPDSNTGGSFVFKNPFEFKGEQVIRILLGSSATSDREIDVTLTDSAGGTLTYNNLTVTSGKNSLVLNFNDGTDSGSFGASGSKVVSIKVDGLDAKADNSSNFSQDEKLQFYSIQVAEYEGALIGSLISFAIQHMSEFPEMEGELATEDNSLLGATSLPTATDSTMEITVPLVKASLSLKGVFTGDLPFMQTTSETVMRTGSLNANKEAVNLFVGVDPKNIAHVSIDEVPQGRIESSSTKAKQSSNSYFVNTVGTAQFSDSYAENSVVVARINVATTIPTIPTGTVDTPFLFLATMIYTSDTGNKVIKHIDNAYVTGTSANVGGSANGVNLSIKAIKTIDPLTGSAKSGSESIT